MWGPLKLQQRGFLGGLWQWKGEGQTWVNSTVKEAQPQSYHLPVLQEICVDPEKALAGLTPRVCSEEGQGTFLNAYKK